MDVDMQPSDQLSVASGPPVPPSGTPSSAAQAFLSDVVPPSTVQPSDQPSRTPLPSDQLSDQLSGPSSSDRPALFSMQASDLRAFTTKLTSLTASQAQTNKLLASKSTKELSVPQVRGSVDKAVDMDVDADSGLFNMPELDNNDGSAASKPGAMKAKKLKKAGKTNEEAKDTEKEHKPKNKKTSIVVKIPKSFLQRRKDQPKEPSADQDEDEENFVAAFEAMAEADREHVEELGLEGIEEWLKNPDENTLDSRLCRLIRERQSFMPHVASISRALSLEILTTNRGNIICAYHHRWDKVGRYIDGIEGKTYKLYGVPFPRKVSRKKSDGVSRRKDHLHCGCTEDSALLDFIFWKTWNIRSDRLDITEGLGNDMLKPR
ncbi:hypothetical protein H0H92_010592, partial [Tricholoma furcatifolium]